MTAGLPESLPAAISLTAIQDPSPATHVWLEIAATRKARRLIFLIFHGAAGG